jgi:hypothetical protein
MLYRLPGALTGRARIVNNASPPLAVRAGAHRAARDAAAAVWLACWPVLAQAGHGEARSRDGRRCPSMAGKDRAAGS